MPLYEYECGKCGHRFEVIQKFSDPPKRKCPVCKSAVRKLLCAPAIQFKGSGWYVTDYAGKKDGRQDKDSAMDGKAETKPGDKAETQSDAKAETKPDAKPKAESAEKSKKDPAK